jgi:hypothetical protein
VSIITPLDSDILLDDLEAYDSGVFRTIRSSFILPFQEEDLRVPYDFYFSENINPLFEKVYANVEYLEGFAKIYNSVLPLETLTCPEYGDDILGLKTSDKFEVTFTKNEITIYQKGVLQQTITQTQFGRFFDIRDVALNGDVLFVLDGNFVLKLDIESNPFKFLTFFGGVGSKSSEYKFKDPVKIILDKGQLYIFDQDTQVLKHYNEFLSFVVNIDVAGVVDVDVVDGVIYKVTTSELIFKDQVIRHGIPEVDKILVDKTQEGFLWVGSTTLLKKYAFNGLEIYSNTREDLISIDRYGTSLMVIDGGSVVREIEYQFVTTILSEDGLAFPKETILIHPDELNSDMVVNDSIQKLYTLLNSFNQKIVGKFVSTLDAESNYVSVDVGVLYPIEDDFLEIEGDGLTIEDVYTKLESEGVIIGGGHLLYEIVDISGERQFIVIGQTPEFTGSDVIVLNHQAFHRHDEIVSCHAWDRTLDVVFDIITYIKNRLIGVEVFNVDSGIPDSLPANDVSFVTKINWSLGSQSCEGIEPQLFNPNFTPLSLEELSIPELSCHSLCECIDALYFGGDGARYTGGPCVVYSTEPSCNEVLYFGGDGARYTGGPCGIYSTEPSCNEVLYFDEAGSMYSDGSCGVYSD